MAALSQPTYSRKDRVLVSNTANESFLMSPNNFKGTRTFAANTLLEGDVIIVRAWGSVSSINKNPGTLRLRLYFPDGNNGSMRADTAALTLPNGLSLEFWEYYHMMTLRGAPGANADFYTQGRLLVLAQTSLNKADGIGAANIDTTVANSMDMSATFSVADPGNQLFCQAVSVEWLTGI